MKESLTTKFNVALKRLTESFATDTIEGIIQQILSLNGIVHCSVVSKIKEMTFEDQLWDNRNGDNFRIAGGKNRYSVAWNLWHSARIEDICSHAFISHEEQIYKKKDYQNKLNIMSKTTGNEFSDSEMKVFNESIDLQQLKKYRNDVGIESRKIINKLNIGIINERVNTSDLKKLKDEGYIAKESEWLLEFWGRKKIAGIITMPLSRHILVHLNNSRKILKIKE